MSYDKSMIEEMEGSQFAKCICLTDITVKTIIVGFPGMGLAGAIAAQHISEKLKLETIGFIEGSVIPSVAVFLDGYLRHPYRIMGRKDSEIAVFIGESAVSPAGAYHMAKAVIEWAEKHGAKEIIVLDGFPFLDPKDETKVYMVAEPEIKEKAEKLDIPPLRSGFIGGFSGAMLNKTMISSVDGYAFLVGTRPDLPDPGGAAALIKTVNTYKETDINIETLKEQSESIKKKLSELALQTQDMNAQQPPRKKSKSTFYT
ncbi:MAG: proteasome assembly chaperone family protein [Candidatus Heimdallarchaeota archaeon]|nr:proteasome assembly chaperone family protein [Candidatus Heimdallarchaeota archaeon]MBY8994110.1 proteasome assembly chaperone family protein [Candidatus Heimdallarchaeota archaeon]